MSDREKERKAVLSELLPEAQHKNMDVLHGERGGYEVRRKATDPLQVYYRREYISGRQYHAGCQLRQDFEIAGVYKLKAIDYGNQIKVRGDDAGAASRQDALDRWRAACLAVTGHGRKMVVDVCCYGYALADLDHDIYTRKDSRMPRFLEALDELAAHYDEQKAKRGNNHLRTSGPYGIKAS